MNDEPKGGPATRWAALRTAGVWLGATVFLGVLDALPWVLLLLVGWGLWGVGCQLWGLVFG
jgi:hypothetical protein